MDIQDMVNEVVSNLEPEEDATIVITFKAEGVEVLYNGVDSAHEEDVDGQRLMIFKEDIYTVAVGIDSEGGVEDA